MKRFLRESGHALPVLVSATALLSLAGCQNKSVVAGPPVIARVAGDPITTEEFYPRVERVTAQQMQPGVDAGSQALVTLIREKMLEKLAQEKHVAPSDADVNQFVSWYRRRQPQVEDDIKAGRVTEQAFIQQVRLQLLTIAVGTDGDKAKPEDITKAYNDHQKDFFTVPPTYQFHALQALSEEAARQGLAKLKTTGDFKSVAKAIGSPPQAVAQADQILTKPADQLTPQIIAALDALKPNDFSPAPVTLSSPQAQGQKLFVVFQLLKKTPKYIFNLEDVRPVLQQIALSTTHPQFTMHEQQELSGFASKADIQIYIDRYKPLLDAYIRPIPTSPLAPAPGGSLNPGANPGMQGASQTAPSGSNAPPSSRGGVPAGGAAPNSPR